MVTNNLMRHSTGKIEHSKTRSTNRRTKKLSAEEEAKAREFIAEAAKHDPMAALINEWLNEPGNYDEETWKEIGPRLERPLFEMRKNILK